MVAGIDEGIGQIIKELQSQVLKRQSFVLSSSWNWRQDKVIVQGKLEETVIGFSIDNGGVPYAGALNYPLRGAKVCLNDDAIKEHPRWTWIARRKNGLLLNLQATLYEGGVRSPGFIHAPKILPRWHGICKSLFSFADCWRSLEEKKHRWTVIKTVIADELLSQDYQPLFHVADFYPTFSALIKQVNFWQKT